MKTCAKTYACKRQDFTLDHIKQSILNLHKVRPMRKKLNKSIKHLFVDVVFFFNYFLLKDCGKFEKQKTRKW